MDLSGVTALAPLADVVRDVVRAAARVEAELFVAGAFARDLWLQFAFDIDTGRATRDLDFAVRCADWETFHDFSEALLEAGFQRPPSGGVHRFVHENGTPIDLVPFGGLERPDRTISWPPDGGQEMSLVGFREVRDSAVPFLLPGDVSVPVASLASLAVLKLFAWQERRLLAPGKDAHDLRVILKNYADAGNRERIFEEIPGLIDRRDFDLELAGAELLGCHIAQAVPAGLRAELLRILDEESDAAGDLRLAGDMARADAESARRLLAACLAGLRATETA